LLSDYRKVVVVLFFWPELAGLLKHPVEKLAERLVRVCTASKAPKACVWVLAPRKDAGFETDSEGVLLIMILFPELLTQMAEEG
jgi:hypothetical protein